jgi:hypothetical protein
MSIAEVSFLREALVLLRMVSGGQRVCVKETGSCHGAKKADERFELDGEP